MKSKLMMLLSLTVLSLQAYSQTGSTSSTIDSTKIAKCLTLHEVRQLNAFKLDYERLAERSDSCLAISEYNDSIYRSTIDTMQMHINDLYENRKTLQEAKDIEHMLYVNTNTLYLDADKKRKRNKIFGIIGTTGGLILGTILGTQLSK